MRHASVLILTLVLCLPTLVAAQDTVHHTVQGTYLRSEMGDYYHAVFLVNGEELSLFCSPWFTQALDAIKPQGEVVIDYVEEYAYIPEAGDVIDIQSLLSVNIPDPDLDGTSFRLSLIREQD